MRLRVLLLVHCLWPLSTPLNLPQCGWQLIWDRGLLTGSLGKVRRGFCVELLTKSGSSIALSAV